MRIRFLRLVPALSTVCLLLGTGSFFVFRHRTPVDAVIAPPPAPWRCIGGCGAGGSGSGTASGIRWIGNSVKGYLLSVECLPETYLSNDFGSLQIAPCVAFHPRWNSEIGVVVPTGLKIGEVRHQANLAEEAHVNGGPGDITARVLYSFGSEGMFSVMAACAFPTGEWDAERGPEQTGTILPRELQNGRGIYRATLRLSAQQTFDDRMLLLGGSFHYPFNLRLDKRNPYLDGDYRAYAAATANRERFYYRHIIKPYGESDRGDYFPPSLQLDAAYSLNQDRNIVHSLQLSFEAALGTAWIRHYDPRRYDPFPDPDHRAWTALLAYGVEYSRFRFPLFAGVGLPISDRRGADNRWNGIDTKTFLKEWLFVTGFTVGMF